MSPLAVIDINRDAFSDRIHETCKIIAPPPSLTVSQWADTYRYVSPEVSSSPGQWRTDIVPYTREIMDCVNDPRVERIVVMKAARMGMTECINNSIGYFIDYDPSTILYVQQTLDAGRDYSNSILKHLIEDTPALSCKVAERKSRDSASTIMYKTFPGGNLKITGANSPRGFRMVNKRVVICDDIDGFERSVGKEGDPVDLAIHRADTAPNRKIILVSSPSVKDFSRIEAEFLQSDMRFYHIPCPLCGEMQQLQFGKPDTAYGLKWVSGKPETAFYLCAHCQGHIMNYQKYSMLIKGKWIATAPFRKAAGFHISQLYSNFIPWSDIVTDWLNSQKSSMSLQVCINTRFGEVFEDRHEKISDETLYGRREKYGPEIPMAAGILTAGVDVQEDRIEITTIAWGEGEESWNIAHKILYGDTSLADVWNALDKYLVASFQHESKRDLWISCAAIDSGFRTKQVNAFVRTHAARYVSQGVPQRLIAVKGASTAGKDIISARPKKTRRFNYEVGTDTAKDTLMAYLKISEPGPGYCHFPLERDQEYFRQLTAEKKALVHDSRGFPKWIWKKKEGQRNEAIDCMVYAYAALQHLTKNYNLNVDNYVGLMIPVLERQRMAIARKTAQAAKTKEEGKASPSIIPESPSVIPAKAGIQVVPRRRRILSQGVTL